MGGTPDHVPEHYREADPAELKIPQARQWLIHGADDDTVPVQFSREYVQQKKKSGEAVKLNEIRPCSHFDVIDPDSAAFKQLTATVFAALG